MRYWFVKILLIVVLPMLPWMVRAQTKIGGNPILLDSNAYLQLGDSGVANKGFLLPRLPLTSTTSPAPLGAHVAGMTVYNTATSATGIASVSPGIYYNTGSGWLRVLASGGPGTYLTSADSGIVFATPSQLAGVSAQKLNIGDTGLMLQSYVNTVRNGLSKQGKAVALGGALDTATTIATTGTRTFALTGLQSGSASDSLLVIDNATGVLRKRSASSGSTVARVSYNSNPGQVSFTVPFTISDIAKVLLFRNGVQVDVVLLNANTVQLEPGVVCDANDEIRIVQIQ